MLQDPRRCRLAGGRDLWTPRLAQSGQTGSHPREEVFSPGVDTWRAEVPGSLCKACGCFSGTKSKAVSLRGNGLPDQPGEVTGGANSRLLSLGAGDMSKCISSGQLSSQLHSHGGQLGGRKAFGPHLQLPLPSPALSGFWGSGEPRG